MLNCFSVVTKNNEKMRDWGVTRHGVMKKAKQRNLHENHNEENEQPAMEPFQADRGIVPHHY